jgi:hypothetical protein
MAIMWQDIYKERMESFIICERNVITMKFLWHTYLVHHETGLRAPAMDVFRLSIRIHVVKRR